MVRRCCGHVREIWGVKCLAMGGVNGSDVVDRWLTAVGEETIQVQWYRMLGSIPSNGQSTLHSLHNGGDTWTQDGLHGTIRKATCCSVVERDAHGVNTHTQVLEFRTTQMESYLRISKTSENCKRKLALCTPSLASGIRCGSLEPMHQNYLLFGWI